MLHVRWFQERMRQPLLMGSLVHCPVIRERVERTKTDVDFRALLVTNGPSLLLERASRSPLHQCNYR